MNNIPPTQARAGESRERSSILIVGGLIAVLMIVTLVISTINRTNPAAAGSGANVSAGIDTNASASADFLEANSQGAGVTTTASGLQYEVITEGTGARPTADNTVTVHYTGTLTDGTVFDSSVERGQPATFPLRNVIAGWTEGVQLMSIGSKYKFTIPSDLAYGPQGRPPTIPANATLIFEIELLGIQ